MRQDMSKVVTETARSGSFLKSKKTGLRINSFNDERVDQWPNRVSSNQIRQYGIRARQSGDCLGPFWRFLRSRVGLSWDRVFSEIIHQTDRRTVAGWRLLDHLKQAVSVDCFMGTDGLVYETRYKPSRAYGFYVHPLTKTLCWEDFPKFRMEFSISKNLRKINGKQYGRVKGIWYFFDKLNKNFPLSEKRYSVEIDGATYFAAVKKQLNSKELFVLGLSNRLF